MSEERFRELLEEKAQAISQDIQGDLMYQPEDMDTSYECYVYTIEPGNRPSYLLGYIYMGPMGEWSYIEDDTGDGIEEDHTVLAQVKAMSPYKEW